MSKEIVKKGNTELGFFSLEDENMLAQMSKDSETYVDNTSAEDVVMPRLKLLQSLSPEVTKANEEYLEGAEAGDIIHNVSQEIHKEGLLFVPAARKTMYIEWKDRESGGGLVKNYGSDDTAYNKCHLSNYKHINSESGNEIVRSIDVYGTIIDIVNKKTSIAIISFYSTKLKKMKIWNTMIRSLHDKTTGNQLPSYAGVYEISSIPETGNKGSWFNFNIKAKGYTLALPEGIGTKVYNDSKDLASMVGENKVKVKHENEGGFIDTLDTKSDKI